MTVLTVFLAPPGPACGVLDVLADLSGVGLVAPFVWVTDGTAPVVTVEAGRRRGSALHEAVIDRRTSAVRLCVVVPAGGGPVVTVGAELDAHEVLRAHTGLTRITRVRAVVARPGDVVPPVAVARDGWHNVVVAPEDSRGPGLGHGLLPGGEVHPVELGRHAAPVLAGLLGLWTGAPGCLLDETQLPPEPAVRLVRGFHRRVEATELAVDLRTRVLDVAELPLPWHQGTAAVPVTDVPDVCRWAAQQVWRQHPEVLGTPRPPIPGPRPVAVSWRDSLRWFFRVLGNAVRRFPRDLADGIVNHTSRAVAATVQQAVFGRGSAYEVVVNGITGRGPLGAEDIATASRRLGAELGAGPIRQQADVDLGPLWSDMADGALTLLDGGDRAAVPPVQRGAQRGVLRRAADAAPGPGHEFAVPPRLVPRLGTSSVHAADHLGVHVLRAGLLHVAHDPRDRNLAHEADRARVELERWYDGHRHGFVAQMGEQLGVKLVEVAQEIVDLAAQLRDADAGQDGLGQRVRGLYQRIRLVLGIVAVLLVAAAVLGATGFVEWPTAAAVGGGVLAAGLAGCIVAYALEQRRLFQEVHRLRELQTRLEHVRAHLGQALVDLRRLSLAYLGFLPWARALGAVLAAPFGPPAAPAAAPPRIRRGLPRSTRLADVVVDPRSTGDAARVLRRSLFATGWLTGPWTAALAAARDPEGVLRPGWEQRVAARGSAAGDPAWDAALALLDAPGGTLRDELLARVCGVEEGGPAEEHLADFLAGIDRPRVGGWFDAEHLQPGVRGSDPAQVDLELVQLVRAGMGVRAVLVQLGGATTAQDLRMCATAGAADDGGGTDGGRRDAADDDVPLVPRFGPF